jgi:hypothetical protein
MCSKFTIDLPVSGSAFNFAHLYFQWLLKASSDISDNTEETVHVLHKFWMREPSDEI